MQAIHIAPISFPILIAILHVGGSWICESLYTLKKGFIYANKIYTTAISLLNKTNKDFQIYKRSICVQEILLWKFI